MICLVLLGIIGCHIERPHSFECGLFLSVNPVVQVASKEQMDLSHIQPKV